MGPIEAIANIMRNKYNPGKTLGETIGVSSNAKPYINIEIHNVIFLPHMS